MTLEEYEDKWETLKGLDRLKGWEHTIENLYYEDELYISYAALHQLDLLKIREWFRDAEDEVICPFLDEPTVVMYLGDIYDLEPNEAWGKFNRLCADGSLKKSGNYWFLK